jgi:hypothetical protein
VGQSLTGKTMSTEVEGIVVICHQETIGEDSADREDVCDVVNCRVCELAIAL